MENGLESSSLASPPPTLDVGIEIEYADKVNFALQQCGVPLISKISLTNRAAAETRRIEVAVSIENGEAAPWTGHIERLDPKSTYNIEPKDFRLSAAKLCGTDRGGTIGPRGHGDGGGCVLHNVVPH
ncbi:MAG: hypothetical protein AB7G11_13895 [Phycisphaerales bacterium]